MKPDKMNFDCCPVCNSSAPHMHPAVQYEGEVEICTHDFHLRPTPQNSEKFRAMVWSKREMKSMTTQADQDAARELGQRLKPSKSVVEVISGTAGLDMEMWTLLFYKEDIDVLRIKYGDKWPVFIRDIINQHTTPYGAPRVKVLADLAVEYKTVKP